MKESEAFLIQQEIIETCKGLISQELVSIDVGSSPTEGSEDYTVVLKCDLTQEARIFIISVISKYNVILKQEKGFVVIYTP